MAPPQPNLPATAWQVTGQQQVMEPGPGGTVQHGVRIYFTTAKGVQSSVFLADAAYNPANVKAAIAPKAYQLDQVQDLTGI